MSDRLSRYDLALALTPGLGPVRIRRLLEVFGSAEQALGARAADWAALPGIGMKSAGLMQRAAWQALRSGEAVDRECDLIAHHGAWLLTPEDALYPRLLRLIPDPPPLLWGRGRLEAEDALAVALVGSRRCTAYGMEQASLFASGLAQQGLRIVSGGAEGIDGAAHEGALRAGGRTVVVLGSGLARPWPTCHSDLFRRVVADEGAHGAVLSEYPMLSPPLKEHFPRRNRIVSGMSLGVLLVEAARKSGALITARQCIEDHNRTLMAVPGRVDSAASGGCHDAIRDGWACLVTQVGDVLDQLGEVGSVLKANMTDEAAPAPRQGQLMPDDKREVWSAILQAASEPRTLDELAVALSCTADKLLPEVTMLEMRGDLKRQGSLVQAGKRFN